MVALVSGLAGGTSLPPLVAVAPAHVAEQLAEVELRQDLGSFGLKRRLPGEQVLVTGQGRHTTIPPLLVWT